MAVSSSRELRQEQTKLKMAGYDRKIALANYFPSINVTGAYMWNNRDVKLLSKDSSEKLHNAAADATAAQQQAGEKASEFIQQLKDVIASNPAMAAEYNNSAMWQGMFQAMEAAINAGSGLDIATPIRKI